MFHILSRESENLWGLELSLSYDFVAFERAGPLWRKLLRIIRNSINSALNRFFPERVEYLP